MNIKGSYLAFVISEESRASILANFPPKFSDVYAHHITVQFNMNEPAYLELMSRFDNAELAITGYASDDSLEALVVSVNGSSVRPDGSPFHCTLSLDQPRKPMQSNALIKAGPIKSLSGMKINARLMLVSK